jgi:glycosyltransferase involved in cell wall biosynthesis
MAPLLSIVTVVKDDEAGLRDTLASLEDAVIGEPDDVEWLIVDSSSNRQTVSKILSHTEHWPHYIWVQPAGVYPAMNVGLGNATGNYILFLNAGDELKDAAALQTIMDVLRAQSPVWLYGQVTFIDPTGQETTPPAFNYQREKDALFARGRFPPHQGTVVRRDVLADLGGFDTNFQVAADYAVALHLSQLADPLELEIAIANFHIGGLSTTEWRRSIREFHAARTQILRPRGQSRIRELVSTGAQFGKLALGRARTRSKPASN